MKKSRLSRLIETMLIAILTIEKTLWEKKHLIVRVMPKEQLMIALSTTSITKCFNKERL